MCKRKAVYFGLWQTNQCGKQIRATVIVYLVANLTLSFKDGLRKFYFGCCSIMSEFYVFAVLWNCQLLYQQYVSIITDLIIDSKRCTCVIFLQLSAFTHNSMEHAKPFLHFDIISLIIYVNKECYFAANICTTIPIWDTDTFFLQTHSLFFKHFKKMAFFNRWTIREKGL